MAGICSRLNLPTPDEARAMRPLKPKHELPTKVDRAIERKDAALLDQKKLRIWARGVKERDGWRDRFTGKKVIGKAIALHPDSAHAHHLEPRENEDTRYDVRNGITLSFVTHHRVERNELKIVGTKWFVVNGKKYIDATAKVKFTDTAGKVLKVG